MHIAIMGTRGVPANYGGFETFAEELGHRLVERGHTVTVYGRTHNIEYRGSSYKGMLLVLLPTIAHKYLDTVVHTFLSVLHGLRHSYDVVLICNAANAAFCWIPRMRGQRVVLNVDGIERKRKKWNALGKVYYWMSEFLATLFPNAIVTDARVIECYYRERFGKSSTCIAYGADLSTTTEIDVIEKFGLIPNQYVLYVSRLEPENNAHHVIHAFERVETDKRLVIVGGAPYSREYIATLHRTRDPRILFTGFVYGRGYWQLRSHAYAYVHATEVGGTHPALI